MRFAESSQFERSDQAASNRRRQDGQLSGSGCPLSADKPGKGGFIAHARCLGPNGHQEQLALPHLKVGELIQALGKPWRGDPCKDQGKLLELSIGLVDDVGQLQFVALILANSEARVKIRGKFVKGEHS